MTTTEQSQIIGYAQAESSRALFEMADRQSQTSGPKTLAAFTEVNTMFTAAQAHFMEALASGKNLAQTAYLVGTRDGDSQHTEAFELIEGLRNGGFAGELIKKVCVRNLCNAFVAWARSLGFKAVRSEELGTDSYFELTFVPLASASN